MDEQLTMWTLPELRRETVRREPERADPPVGYRGDWVPWVRALCADYPMVPPTHVEGSTGRLVAGWWAEGLVRSEGSLRYYWRDPGFRPTGPRSSVYGHAWAVACVRPPGRLTRAAEGRGLVVGPFTSPAGCQGWWDERAGKFRAELPLWAPVQVWYLLPPEDPAHLVGGKPWREVDRSRPPWDGGDPREYIDGRTGQPVDVQPWLDNDLRRDLIAGVPGD